ncbi:TPA: hypothetical protein N0F65_005470 [Lagenidium giganteum]|uniref:Transposase n=1 Tax=Lagenidium giganteum TaxID=4803 RepID=A0AAV2YX97_9STRA|nr:TPA: hypothetical protein N0F65_005470 [Lagenidium giganteum]
MTSAERKASILTCFAALSKSDEALASTRRLGTIRARYSYHLPLVGAVCRATFCKAFDIAPATVARYKQRVASGIFSATDHGGKANKNAQKIDTEWLELWFTKFARTVGDIVSVCMLTNVTKESKLIRTTTLEDHVA